MSSFGVIGLTCLVFAPNWRWWIAVPGVALAIFAGYEGYLLATYGQSNFLLSVAGHRAPDTSGIKNLTVASVTYTGALAPFVAVADWGAITRGQGLAMTMAGIFVAAFLALAFLPETLDVANPLTGRGLRLHTPILAGLGLLPWNGLAISLLIALLKSRLDRRLVFLILWFGIELVGYFVLSPFPAACRFVTPLAAMTLLAAATSGPRAGCGTCHGRRWGRGITSAAAPSREATDPCTAPPCSRFCARSPERRSRQVRKPRRGSRREAFRR